MGSNIEELCGMITEDELSQSVLGLWVREAGAKNTNIDYTFKVSELAYEMIAKSRLALPATVQISTLQDHVRIIVNKILTQWANACGHHVRFRYVAEPELQQTFITFIGCDNIPNVSGITFWNTRTDLYPGTQVFDKVTVCIPSQIHNEGDWSTIAHEIGHALGLKHFHDLPSLVQRLRHTPQGLGCSVMNYVSRLKTPVNECNSEQYCLNQIYAVAPGPIDKQVCTFLYGDKTVLAPVYYNLNMLAQGFFNGVLERFLFVFLSHIEYKNNKMNEFTAKNIALACTILLRIYWQSSFLLPAILFILLETIVRTTRHEYLEWIEFFRTIVSACILFLSFSSLSANDALGAQTAYAFSFLAATVCGIFAGQCIAKPAAYASNHVLNKASRGIDVVVEVISNTPNKIYSSCYSFFSGRTLQEDDDKQQHTLTV